MTPRRSVRLPLLALAGLFLAETRALAEDAAPIKPTEALVLRQAGARGPGRGRGRSIVNADPLVSRWIRDGWASPKPGDSLELNGGKASWEPVAAGKDGAFTGPGMFGGQALVKVQADKPGVQILQANGANSVLVNGDSFRPGDVYGYGYVKLPIALKAGGNDLLFQTGRGRLSAELVEPKAVAQFNTGDVTAPDFLVGREVADWLGVIVLNASEAMATDLSIRSRVGDAPEQAQTLPTFLPLATRKVGVRLQSPAFGKTGEQEVTLRLFKGGKELDKATLKLRVRKPDESHRRTFLSQIDGSVQYFGVQPARPLPGSKEAPALVLSLHGASVEAMGQADAYGPKRWAHVVAPTNRRPYGFDWEDWGRMDAIEVLELAQKQLRTDPSRVYLTGHSMGGHGTWQVGATFPDRFAAIGPSAGWISMMSYAGVTKPEPADPLAAILSRALNPSDTLGLARNYLHQGIYILHGDADDNVPVAQARTMKKVLEGFHRDLSYYEQPKAGHWWGGPNEDGGTACVDWAPMFDLFSKRRLPENAEVREVEFATMNPAISSRSRWASIEAQAKPLAPSTIKLNARPFKRRFDGTTQNVARLALDVRHLAPGEPIEVELDGTPAIHVEWPGESGKVWLERDAKSGVWASAKAPSKDQKGPHRAGPFKEAFRNRMVFVYGTHGSEAENALWLAKARHDAETFWYRGNGSVDVMPDTAFDPKADVDRSVILYGNAASNGVWDDLLGSSPVQVKPGEIKVGDRVEKGENLACLVVRPRPDSDVASVAAVSATGLVGERLTFALPYFISGVAFPDVTVATIDGAGAQVKGAGFFGNDWSIASGEFAWK